MSRGFLAIALYTAFLLDVLGIARADSVKAVPVRIAGRDFVTRRKPTCRPVFKSLHVPANKLLIATQRQVSNCLISLHFFATFDICDGNNELANESWKYAACTLDPNKSRNAHDGCYGQMRTEMAKVYLYAN